MEDDGAAAAAAAKPKSKSKRRKVEAKQKPGLCLTPVGPFVGIITMDGRLPGQCSAGQVQVYFYIIYIVFVASHQSPACGNLTNMFIPGPGG